MIQVRGHTLLCFQGFRGEGYSPAFVENMTRIQQDFSREPQMPVRVTDAPDQVCASCPNLSDGGCHLNGPGSEKEMAEQDRDVLRRLGLEKGQVYSWGEILHRIGQSLKPDDLDEICEGCRWLPLGYCKEGIRRLTSG